MFDKLKKLKVIYIKITNCHHVHSQILNSEKKFKKEKKVFIYYLELFKKS